MTVAELVEKLLQMPQELEVMTKGYEGGVDLIQEPRLVDIALDVYDIDDPIFGRHMLMDEYSSQYYDSSGRAQVVYMPRS